MLQRQRLRSLNLKHSITRLRSLLRRDQPQRPRLRPANPGYRPNIFPPMDHPHAYPGSYIKRIRLPSSVWHVRPGALA